MALIEAQIANFETLKRAAANGDLALLECRRLDTGATVAVLVAIVARDGEYHITPFAEMYSSDPYEILELPLFPREEH